MCSVVPNEMGKHGVAALVSFQWLYILFVLTGIAIGIWGIWATAKFVRGTSDSFRMSLYALVAGVFIGGFHIDMSRMLRGKSMPVDAVVYMTVFTLVVFYSAASRSFGMALTLAKATVKAIGSQVAQHPSCSA